MNKNRQTTFNFKRFSLHNEQSGMKVGTDGVVLGAWTNLPSKGLVLDVGTGTGLIALMVAQRSECRVVGIEIDEVASAEAKKNAAASPFRDRVEILNTDFADYATTTTVLFDV
ncbi:MAG: methyltransferase domain-containing protein, partial [Muribaculaceae bacterium]|nr:methyltransferase domain-containing protein [Muribaculaceae bacterium]